MAGGVQICRLSRVPWDWCPHECRPFSAAQTPHVPPCRTPCRTPLPQDGYPLLYMRSNAARLPRALVLDFVFRWGKGKGKGKGGLLVKG